TPMLTEARARQQQILGWWLQTTFRRRVVTNGALSTAIMTTGSAPVLFAEMHPVKTPDAMGQVLKLLYDKDILAEEAMLAWADEKEHGDEEDKTYVLKVRMGRRELCTNSGVFPPPACDARLSQCDSLASHGEGVRGMSCIDTNVGRESLKWVMSKHSSALSQLRCQEGEGGTVPLAHSQAAPAWHAQDGMVLGCAAGYGTAERPKAA
ncbi:eIF4-gamma/eIF5/eIF2-epsilon, partial [Haematococcus lacustris]